MGNLLDTPKTEKVDCHLFTSSTGLNCGGVGMQGWRIEMEDAHIIADLPSLPDHTFVAVFDGIVIIFVRNIADYGCTHFITYLFLN